MFCTPTSLPAVAYIVHCTLQQQHSVSSCTYMHPIYLYLLHVSCIPLLLICTLYLPAHHRHPIFLHTYIIRCHLCPLWNIPWPLFGIPPPTLFHVVSLILYLTKLQSVQPGFLLSICQFLFILRTKKFSAY